MDHHNLKKCQVLASFCSENQLEPGNPKVRQQKSPWPRNKVVKTYVSNHDMVDFWLGVAHFFRVGVARWCHTEAKKFRRFMGHHRGPVLRRYCWASWAWEVSRERGWQGVKTRSGKCDDVGCPPVFPNISPLKIPMLSW